MAARDTLPCSLDGRRYLVELKEFQRGPVDALRTLVDQGIEPGEQSFSSQGEWKRTQESFRLGAGQDWFDLAEGSNRRRFDSSMHIDVWQDQRAALFRRVEPINVTVGTFARLISGDHETWLATDDKLYKIYDNDGTWPAAAVGANLHVAANDFNDVTTMGGRIFLTDGANVYDYSSGDANTAVFSTENCNVIAYASGRLLAAQGDDLFELDSAGVRADVFTHPQGALCRAIVGAPNGIYASFHNGVASELYIVVNDDATGALGAARYVGAVPNGEQIRTLEYYAGLLLIGTDLGFRLALPASNGDLSIGPLIEIPGGVVSFDPFGQYVWFNWNDPTDTRTGLGRMDLASFTADLVPAYATDLMAPAGTTGRVLAVATASALGLSGVVEHRRFFAVRNDRVYYERDDTPFEAEGWLRTSRITFGTPELKRANMVDIGRAGASGGPIDIETTSSEQLDSTTGGTVAAGTRGSAPLTAMDPAEWFQLRFVFTAGSAVTTEDDDQDSINTVLRRWTLRATAIPPRTDEIYLPIVLHDEVASDDDQTIGFTPSDEVAALEALYESHAPVTLIFGAVTKTVRVAGIINTPGSVRGWDARSDYIESIVTVKLTTVEST